DDEARPMHVVGLEARGRVGNLQRSVDAEGIAAPGASLRNDGPAPALAGLGDRQLPSVEHERDLAGGRGPDGEMDSLGCDLGAERHRMRAPHQLVAPIPANWKSTSERAARGKVQPASRSAGDARTSPAGTRVAKPCTQRPSRPT